MKGGARFCAGPGPAVACPGAAPTPLKLGWPLANGGLNNTG